MGQHSEAFIGIDTSKLKNAVAIAEAGRDGEVRYLGEFDTTEAATRKLIARLAAKYDKLTFCYEAGPTGYGLHRLIESLGHRSIVAAPSLIPKRAGDHVKTNRRDAESLARNLRAGALTAVWVPDERHEAMRDLSRARGAALDDLKSKRQQISSLLLRLGLHYPAHENLGKSASQLARLDQARATRAALRVRGAAACRAPGAGAHRSHRGGDPRGGSRVVVARGRDGAAGGARHRSDHGSDLSWPRSATSRASRARSS